LEGTGLHRKLSASTDRGKWLERDGVFARSFKVDRSGSLLQPTFTVKGDLVEVTDTFNRDGRGAAFLSAGSMVNRDVTTQKVMPRYTGPVTTLGDVLVDEDLVPDEYFINGEVDQWAFLKGSKTL